MTRPEPESLSLLDTYVQGGDWFYLLQSINPVGGLLISVPWGIFEMRYSAWFIIVTAPLLGYVQVMAADLLWEQLRRLQYVRRLLEENRSPRVERLIASSGAFLPTFIATPILGGWVVMLVMRYAQVPQRRVALPILLSLGTVTAAVVVLCESVPHLFVQ